MEKSPDPDRVAADFGLLWLLNKESDFGSWAAVSMLRVFCHPKLGGSKAIGVFERSLSMILNITKSECQCLLCERSVCRQRSRRRPFRTVLSCSSKISREWNKRSMRLYRSSLLKYPKLCNATQALIHHDQIAPGSSRRDPSWRCRRVSQLSLGTSVTVTRLSHHLQV